MKIIIETSDSERVALQPEMQPLLRQGAGSSIELAATDGGAPSPELLQSLSERNITPMATAATEAGQPYRMEMSGGEASQSRH